MNQPFALRQNKPNSNPISYPAESKQIAQSTVVSVPLIQPVREVDLI